MQQKDLAHALGLSESAVCRLIARGMPKHDAAAAAQWRTFNVRPRMNPRAAPAAMPQHRDGAELMQQVEQLAHLAATALQLGQFEIVEPGLRAAIRALPDTLRARIMVERPARPGEAADPYDPLAVAIPIEVFEALIGRVRAVCVAEQQRLEPAEPMSDADAEWLGRFWLSVAAGEIQGQS